jgi:thiamine biosynthesis protein ThiS
LDNSNVGKQNENKGLPAGKLFYWRNGMRVSLGGKDMDIQDGLTLQELVSSRPGTGRVLVELNGNLIKTEQWGQTQLKPGDKIDLIQVVVGG